MRTFALRVDTSVRVVVSEVFQTIAYNSRTIFTDEISLSEADMLRIIV